MAITTIRMIEDYAEISEKVLAETSIIRTVSHKDIQGDISKGEQLKVYVHELPTIGDYVPGTGISQTADGSAYVTLNNLKDKAVNEPYDGLSVDKVYNRPDYVVNRLEGAVRVFGEQVDTDGFDKMVTDGTEVYAAAITKTSVSTIYERILALKEALDNAKAPRTNRSLILTPEMENFLLDQDAKVILQEPGSKAQQVEGAVGRLLGFDIFSTTLLPTGTNMIALQERGFAHTDDWTVAPFLTSLDQSEDRVGDSALKGRMAYNSGAIRPTLIQVDNSAA